ncbi:MAG: MFS transporter [Cyclobacteriaceae bacterium]|nr:MFS transporter [Cyclobacteriaceae bacterium]
MELSLSQTEPFIQEEKSTTIQWRQLWSLAALYGSIVIGWIAYQNYQPKLLEKFHFTEFTLFLTIAQGIILVITPPIAGKIGDRFRIKSGHRLPIITLGISFAAMVFMAVAFTLFTNPGEIFRWILPILIIFWLIAMSIFTSPALSTIELFTPIERMPKAMALLTIVGNLLYALEPVIVDIIDFLGAPLTFVTGGLIVFLSGYFLRENSLSLFKQKGVSVEAVKKDVSDENHWGFIFLMGLGMGLATSVMFNLFPRVYDELLGFNGKWMLVLILVVSAGLSLPLSNVVNNLGLKRSFYRGMIVIIGSMIAIFLTGSAVVVIILTAMFTVVYAVLSVSTLPLAIQLARSNEKVLCVGIFFSGVALPDAIIQTVLLVF